MGGNEGGEPDDGPAGTTGDEIDAEAAAWPGLESLPPSPPLEYPPARPFRRRRRPEPVIVAPSTPSPCGPAALSPESTLAVPPRRRSRGPLIAALVAVLVLLVLVPALVVLGRDDGEQEEMAAATATTTTAQSSTSTSEAESTTTTSTSTTSATAPPAPRPPLAPTPDPPLDAAIAEGAAFVEANRGLAFTAAPVGVRLPDAEFEARVREQAVARLPAIEAEGSMLKLQGVIAEDTDYVEEYLSTYPTLVGAYYDSATTWVVLRGQPGSPVDAEVAELIAHELTHVVDDQHFAFATRAYIDPGTELQFGLRAVSEGDAQRTQRRWAEAHGRRWLPPSAGGRDGVVAAQFDISYVLGELLVDDVVARGGLDALNVAFDDPPSTSEQILHPAKYHEREQPIAMPAPEPGGSPVWEGVTGEYTTGLMLASVLEQEAAERAAEGWGNDRGVMWVQTPADGGLTCLRIAYVMDTPEDREELENAFAAWSYEAENRYVYREGDTVIVTSCAPVPPPRSGASPA